MCLLCDNGGDHDAFLEAVQLNIDMHGVTYVAVEGTGFVYTVGLTAQGRPELYIDARSDVHDLAKGATIEQGYKRLLETLVEILADEPLGGRRLERLCVTPNDGPSYNLSFQIVNSEKLKVARRLYGLKVQAVRVRRIRQST